MKYRNKMADVEPFWHQFDSSVSDTYLGEEIISILRPLRGSIRKLDSWKREERYATCLFRATGGSSKRAIKI